MKLIQNTLLGFFEVSFYLLMFEPTAAIFGQEVFEWLNQPGLVWEYMEETPVIRPEHAARYDAICAMLIRFNPQSLGPEKPRLKVIARFGVGYDTIDVPTCQKAGIFLTIAPDGVRRPVAMSAITFMLMLAYKAYRQGCEAIFNISFDVSLLYLKRFLFY